MEAKRLTKPVVGLFLIILMVSFLAASTESSFAAPIELKAVLVIPVHSVQGNGFKMFANRVNEQLKGKVKINILGGPEVVPPFQLDEAVTKGMIDMCLDSSSYYASLLPESEAVMFSNLPALEARKIIYDTMVDLHKKVGLRYLGDTLRSPMFVYSNVIFKKPGDLKGKKIRIFPAIIPFVKSLGAIPVQMKMGDIYSAMDRGVVDGFVRGPNGFVKTYHLNEVTKYVVVHKFYSASLNIIVNLKKWNEIPKNLQDRIVEINHEVYPDIVKLNNKTMDADFKELLDNGVKPLKFAPADVVTYLNLAYKTGWQRVINKSPTLGPKLQKMLFKKFE